MENNLVSNEINKAIEKDTINFLNLLHLLFERRSFCFFADVRFSVSAQIYEKDEHFWKLMRNFFLAMNI
jgi:hypothetical protein